MKKLESKKASLTYTLFGGTITSITLGNKELLFISKLSQHEKTAVRGGIPVIWPWFGVTERGRHGIARIQQFTVEKEVTTDDLIELELKYELESLQCILSVRITDFASISLCTTCIKEYKQFQQALHTYFRFDEPIVKMSGLSDCFVDATNNDSIMQ